MQIAKTHTQYRLRWSGRVPTRVGALLTMGGALALLPASVFAVDTPVDTQRSPTVVFIVIVLLIGSVTAGLLFASPLRGRLGRGKSDAPSSVSAGLSRTPSDGLPAMPGGDIFGNEFDAGPSTDEPDSVAGDLPPYEHHAWPPPGKPTYPVPQPPASRNLRPPGAPWSTTDTQPNSTPERDEPS